MNMQLSSSNAMRPQLSAESGCAFNDEAAGDGLLGANVDGVFDDVVNPPPHLAANCQMLLGLAAYNAGGIPASTRYRMAPDDVAQWKSKIEREAAQGYAGCGISPPNKATLTERHIKTLSDSNSPLLSVMIGDIDTLSKRMAQASVAKAARQRLVDSKQQLVKLRAELPRACYLHVASEMKNNRERTLDYLFGEHGGYTLNHAVSLTMSAFLNTSRSARAISRFGPTLRTLITPSSSTPFISSETFLFLDVVGGADAILTYAASITLLSSAIGCMETFTVGRKPPEVDEVVMTWLASIGDRKNLFLPAFGPTFRLFAKTPPHLREDFFEHLYHATMLTKDMLADIYPSLYDGDGSASSFINTAKADRASPASATSTVARSSAKTSLAPSVINATPQPAPATEPLSQKPSRELAAAQKALAKAEAELEALREERAETKRLLAGLLNADEDNAEAAGEVKQLRPLTSMKGLVIGGHQNWHQKLKKVLPALRIIHPDKPTVDVDLIAEADYVVFHAGYANHRQFRTAIDYARQVGKRICYVGHVNVGLFLQEICEDLQATY